MPSTAPDSDILPVPQDEKNLTIEEADEKAPEVVDPQWKNVIVDAIDAEHDERSMGVRQAFKLYPKAVLWSFAMSLVLIMEGFDTSLDGVTGLPFFRRDYGVWAGEENGYQLLPVWQAAIGYGSTIGSFVGIFMSSWFQDRYGYRHCIQVSMVMFTGFHFILMFAPNIETFFAGKVLLGLPWGAFSSSAVSYSAEVTPVQLRAYLTTYNNLCWVIGQFLANGVLRGTQQLQNKWSYKIPLAIQYFWCIPLFLVATFAPESPWWLVKQGRIELAEKAVKQLQSKNDANDPAKTVALMVRTNQMEVDHHVGSSFLDCFKGVNLRRTEIACMAWSAQVLCGSWFGGGSAYFFQQAGLSTETSFSFSLGGSAMGIAGTVVSWITITYVGRRKVFLWGHVVLCLLLMLIGFLAIPARHGNTGAPWGQAIITMFWTFTYDFTVGPVAYCIAAEIPSARLRGKTVGLARNAYNIWGVVAGVIQPYMLNPLAWNLAGYQGFGFFWGCTCFVCLVWSYFRLPECKGRTFRELDILFEKKVPARKFAGTLVSLESEEITRD